MHFRVFWGIKKRFHDFASCKDERQVLYDYLMNDLEWAHPSFGPGKKEPDVARLLKIAP